MNTLILVGICVFILLIISLIICIIVVSIKYFRYFNSLQQDGSLALFISTSDDDGLINIEEVEHVVQRYNTIEKQYEIKYFLKSGCQIKEIFDDRRECSYRFQSIKELLQ